MTSEASAHAGPERDSRERAAPGESRELERAEASLQSDPSEALALATELLQGPVTSTVAGRALLVKGRAEHLMGNLQTALDTLQQARSRFAGLGSKQGELEAVLPLARVARDLGKLELAGSASEEALALSRALGNAGAEADALYLRASVSNVEGDYAMSLRYLEEALTIVRERGFKERLGNVLSGLGNVYTGLGDHVKALESLTEANEVVREVAPGSRSETANLIALGALYSEMGESQAACEFFERARELSRAADDLMLEAAALNNLACTYNSDGDAATARGLFEEALTISRMLDVRQYEIDNLDGLGQCLTALGEHGRAVEAHTEALGVARGIGDLEGEIDALINLGRDHLNLGAPGQARGFLEEGLALAQQAERKHSVFEAHELLSQVHELQGNLAEAFHHHREFYRVERAVFNEESESQKRRLTAVFDLERARHEAEQYRLRVEVSQQAREEAEAEVRERTRDLEEAQREIVTRLAVAAEYRDDETGEHTRRVGRNAAAIAQALGWSPDEVSLIFTASRLHDVGKIGISDNILLKPGKLDPEEFDQIRAHTTIGARILSGGNSSLLRLAEEIALSHHERWDGKGYPLGLAGEAIPMSARIVSVADVLDALTHSRPYKHAWPVKDALAEIKRQAGRQFDPRVVSACLEVFGERGGLSPLDAAETWPGAPSHLLASATRQQPRGELGGIEDRLEKLLAQRTQELERAKVANRSAVRQLEELAYTDPLTGLANRRAFETNLDLEVTRAQRSGDDISVMMVEVDALKDVNDEAGHERGDALLRAIAEVLQQDLQDVGRMYRLTGDEFALVLPHLGPDGFARVHSAVEDAVGKLRQKGFPEAGLSAGIASLPAEASDARGLMDLSDRRMLLLKKERRGSATIRSGR